MQINPLTVIHNGEAYGFNFPENSQKIRSTSVKEADLIS